MTACAIESATDSDHDAARSPRPTHFSRPPRPALPGLVLAADGSYAARLARCAATGGHYPERWTLHGPEPYAVPLHGTQPEEPGTEVLPLADGQVLICRRVAGHHRVSLLYPAGAGTGERPLGPVDRAELSLLPPAPGGTAALALSPAPDGTVTQLWLVYGDGAPRRLTEVPGRCTGGIWLDRAGWLLALDRELDGRTKTVVLDLRHGGGPSPLLQLTEESEDRLLLADPDSGLLLLRSDAPGEDRLGWGVLGSTLPVRFPECLRGAGDAGLTPFAAQPGQPLAPESCAVAFRITGGPAAEPGAPGGGEAAVGPAAPAGRAGIGLWRPSERRVRRLTAPEGWLTDAGFWTSGGELWLPYATATTPCGLRRVCAGGAGAEPGRGSADRAPAAGGTAPGPRPDAPADGAERAGEAGPGACAGAPADAGTGGPAGAGAPAGADLPEAADGSAPGRPAGFPAPVDPRAGGRAGPPAATRPVPLQQAPLAREKRRADWFEDPLDG
ncbi:hypothetical protein [Streptomyces sp. NPDC018031]|uniref:hypothetical protein n=1 Tax=Streptomyces sp. NPDC018031 TaxID=3365033 RepID=UPI0037893A70